MNYAGGCLCGALRYTSSVKPIEVAYCHCRMCQRLTGATLVPWAIFSTETFSYTQGQPKIYVSSAHGRREFCENCGSQIAFRSSRRNDNVDITVGTLDDPEAAVPQYHVWCNSRVSWFETADNLPRHRKSGEQE